MERKERVEEQSETSEGMTREARMEEEESGSGRRRRRGLTLVDFSAQPEPFLTQNTP